MKNRFGWMLVALFASLSLTFAGCSKKDEGGGDKAPEAAGEEAGDKGDEAGEAAGEGGEAAAAGEGDEAGEAAAAGEGDKAGEAAAAPAGDGKSAWGYESEKKDGKKGGMLGKGMPGFLPGAGK